MFGISRKLAGAAVAYICTTSVPPMALAQSTDMDRYVLCSFRPQTPSCERVYQLALHDQSPSANSVAAAFEGYGRYVRNAIGPLTDEDRRYLAASDIRLPDLTPEDQAGLHALLSDPALQKDAAARRVAANNFISRAVQAELYCAFNSCNQSERMASTTEGVAEER
jgi:hypothetical protein